MYRQWLITLRKLQLNYNITYKAVCQLDYRYRESMPAKLQLHKAYR